MTPKLKTSTIGHGGGFEALVEPAAGIDAPDLGRMAVMISSEADFTALSRRLHPQKGTQSRLFTSHLTMHGPAERCFALVGPLIGAPYATMVLEKLIARGAKTVLFFGWCGAVSPALSIGDILIPSAALIDEGTSKHYSTHPSGIVSRPGGEMAGRTRSAFLKRSVLFHEGLIWTTDAVYRETRERVLHYQSRNVLAVEMELSALFTVAGFRGIDLCGVLVVSDELYHPGWKAGFSDSRFKAARQTVCDMIEQLCKSPTD